MLGNYNKILPKIAAHENFTSQH